MAEDRHQAVRTGTHDGPGTASNASAQHSGDAPREASPPDVTRRGAPPGAALIADLMLIAVCAWFLWSDLSDAWMGDVGMQSRTWTFMLNITCAFVLVHRGMALLQSSVPGAARTSISIAKWAMAIVLPLLVATGIERQVHEAHKTKLDALAADVAARSRASVVDSGSVTAAALASLRSPYLRLLRVQVDTGAFDIEVLVPAIGVEHYVARYSSTDPGWHLDAVDAESTTTAAAAAPTLICTPSDRGLSCR